MRGDQPKQSVMMIAVSVDGLVKQRLPADHPLRAIKKFTDEILDAMSPDIDTLYSKHGRPSVAPELLLRALLWKALFSVRSERQLETELCFNMLARWFVGLPLDHKTFDPTTFSKNRESLRLEILSEMFFRKQLEFLREKDLLSSEHLSVDGTLLAAWASPKSMVERSKIDDDGKPPPPPPGGRNGWVDFKGEKRSNKTHVSASDPDARLANKGGGTRLSHELNILSENRNNFAIGFSVNSPTGTSEREAARVLVERECAEGRTPSSVGGDRKYADGDALVLALDDLGVAAHFSVRDDRPNAIARVFQDDPGYRISIVKRMRIEEIMAFIKTISGLAKVKLRTTLRVHGLSAIALSAYNLTHWASVTSQ